MAKENGNVPSLGLREVLKGGSAAKEVRGD